MQAQEGQKDGQEESSDGKIAFTRERMLQLAAQGGWWGGEVMALDCLDVVDDPTTANEQDMIDLLVDDIDQEHPSLMRNEILMRAAQVKASDMANRNYFSHTNPDGYGPNWLVTQMGYVLPAGYSTADDGNDIESISAGDVDAADIWAVFMASEPHRDHLLGRTEFFAEQDEYGVGYAFNSSSTYDHYWVILIAKHA